MLRKLCVLSGLLVTGGLYAETGYDVWLRYAALDGEADRQSRAAVPADLSSRRLGLQTLTEITGNHYGVAVEASENNGWGQWHRADAKGVGMDRTMATGTGFIGRFRPAVAKMYESLATCPDDLLVFMHQVPCTHMLHSGKTVIQHLHDSHYEGAEAATQYVLDWKSLQGRIEAESMKLEGYAPRKVIRFEAASGETAVRCPVAQLAVRNPGGLLECKKIADLADLCLIPMAAHNTGSILCNYATLQWSCAVKDFIASETIIGRGGWMDDIIVHDGPIVKDGHIALPDKPGLGVELNPDVVKAHLAPGEVYWS